MRVGIIGSPSGWYVQQLCRAAWPQDEACVVPFSQLATQVARGKGSVAGGDVQLGALDALVVRSMAPGSLEQVVFRMDALHVCQDAGLIVVNSPRSLEVAVDKYLAMHRLQQAGLPVPPTSVCQTFEQAMVAYHELGPDVVLKPLFGSEGRGMSRVTDVGLAERACRLLCQLGAVVYMQRFVPHTGCDWRLLVVDQQVFGMERRQAGDWRTNICRGGRPHRLAVDDRLREMALRAARAVGARWAGVDILPADDGRWYVLEVNAVPGWRAVAEVTGTDVAALLWQDLHRLFAGR